MTGLIVRRNNRFPLLLAGLAIVGVFVTWVHTPWGVRVGHDSLFYLSAAQNVLKGLGLSRLTAEGQGIPLTHYPPLYSLLVAGFSFLVKGDIFLSARWIAVLGFGLTVFLFGFLCYRYSRSGLAGLLGACFCLGSPILLTVSIAAFSEGTFIFLLLLALWLIAKSLPELEPRSVLAAAALTAFTCLTRYVGNATILAGVAAILLLSTQSLKKKIGAAILYGAASSLPIALWYLRNWMVTGNTTNRTFAVHLPGKAELYQALNTMTAWILPESLPFQIRFLFSTVVFLMVCASALRWGVRLHREGKGIFNESAFQFSLLLSLYASIYLFSLVVSRAFFDSSTRWEVRILSPLYIAGSLLAVIVLWNGFQLERHAWRKISFAALFILWIVGYLPESVQFLNQNRLEGGGFAGPAWKNSATMQALKRFPLDAIFYSNNTTAIYFVLGKPANGIPERYDSVKAQVRADYETNLSNMREALKRPHSALVIFKPYRNVPEYPPLEELTAGLVLLEATEDGTIYVSPGHNP
jgi:hypothetical protein